MRTIASHLFVGLALGVLGCDSQLPNPPKSRPFPMLAGTNAGTNKQLTGEVSGWTYSLVDAQQDRIAGYQCNASGSVVATVGKQGQPNYPAMFWRIDEQDQIVISDERDFSTVAEAWTVISIEGETVKVKNAVNHREETYYRKQHWPPAAKPDAPVEER